MDLDGAKQSPLGLVLSRFEQVIHSLALVPLKSASRASISSSEPSAFSITLRPPDLLVGTKEVSFPRLWVKDIRLFSTEIVSRLEEVFRLSKDQTETWNK